MKHWILYFATQWRVFVLNMAIFTSLGLLYLINASPAYRVSMTVAAAGGSDAGNAVEPVGQITGQVGVRLGGPDGVGGFDLFLIGLKSPSAMPLLPDRDALMRRIFAPEWDDKTQTWRAPEGFWFALRSWFAGLLGRPAWTPPNDQRLAAYVAGALSIRGTAVPNVQHLVITGPNPALAVDLLQSLYRAADQLSRQRELAKLETLIQILQSQLAIASLAEQREVIAKRWLKLVTAQALARSDAPFVVTMLEPPSIPAQPVSPNISGVLLLSLIGGVGVGFIVALLRADAAAPA